MEPNSLQSSRFLVAGARRDARLGASIDSAVATLQRTDENRGVDDGYAVKLGVEQIAVERHQDIVARATGQAIMA
jgi:hypothetical protein